MEKRFLDIKGAAVCGAEHIHGPWYCLYEPGADVQEAEEMFSEGKTFWGSEIMLADVDTGRIAEPFKRAENIFVSRPIWDGEGFAFFEVDFPAGNIGIYRYFPGAEEEKGCSGVIKRVADIPLRAAVNCRNMRLVMSPLTLVRGDYDQYDRVDILWPERISFDVEPRESLDFRDGDRFYFSCWQEDPDYREEVIVRDMDGRVEERYPGTIHFFDEDMKLIIKKIL